MTTTKKTSSPAMAVPTALSVIAGVTDVTSWLLLGGFFSAHVTGNLVVIAADTVTGARPGTALLLAVPSFIIVTAIATVVAARLGAKTPRSTYALLGAQAVFLIAAAILSFTGRASADPEHGIAIVIGICAVSAMAAQNAYLHLASPKTLSTAVMTGNLVGATVSGMEIIVSRGRSDSARAQWTQTWPLIVGFLGGCVVGAFGATLLSDHAAVVPAVLATVLLAGIVWNRRRSERGTSTDVIV
ncbi:YoaK family protein [Leifsonia sp. NPDC058248]|uniref:YoaK family protein n=1 Tax=Leifsonia sp. NPDC058248 TaxID=3346402 RepID=UPI0036DAF15E